MRLRPRAEVICFKGNKVLCGINTEGDYCLFPGGGVDPNESAVQAAKREALEECDRKVTGCTVAHPATTQVWPKDYAASNEGKWGKGFDGGITYWMTGSTSDGYLHEDPKERHEDFEKIFEWKPISVVLDQLKKELGNDTDWADDVKTRIAILEAHQAMHERVKKARCAGQLPITPTLQFQRPTPGASAAAT